jgi:hypothetical protein
MRHLTDGLRYTRDGIAVARVAVSKGADGFSGTANVALMPLMLRRLFDRYKEIVAGQILTLLDEIEADIAEAGWSVALGGQPSFDVSDLQLFPSTGRISFQSPVYSSVSLVR